MQLEQHFADQMGHLLGPDFPAEIALAVSGGGDSMAMLHLAAGWARIYGIRLPVVTVDHGLREESAAEAALVADEAAGLGLPHDTLRWQGWDGQGNLQDAARRARLDLIAGWLGSCRHVLMAHTQDDQAETLLMRLLRGSGVDGLGGMHALRTVQGAQGPFRVVRPLLDVPRAALRHHATVLKLPFVDDPSNADTRFDRVRLRAVIAEVGLDVANLAATAARMQAAQTALEARAQDVVRAIVRTRFAEAGYLALDRDALATVEADTRLRLCADAVRLVGRQTYRPRLAALTDAVDRVLSGGQATLHGCIMLSKDDTVLICREFQPVRTLSNPPGQPWDRHWHLSGPAAPDLTLAALGPALSDCPDWRTTGHPRAALLASPAVFSAGRLIAAPLAGYGSDWQARIALDSADTLFAH